MKLIADLHTHTIASTHAYSTITENCKWAKINGIELVAMTDHTEKMPDSPHYWHFENLRILPRKIDDIIVLKGAETNIIDFDGNIDLPESSLENLEWVIASMHNEVLKQGTVEEITETYLKAMKNPHIDMIGHPTTAYFQCDFERLVKGAVENNKILEINESSVNYKKGSRENSYELLKICKKYNALVAVNTDSHFCQNVGIAPTAMKILEECEFPERLVINSSMERLSDWIYNKRNIKLL
ncbi:MAG: phosphatase [Ruminococcus sp.]|nr:phosphatase [Ruminococcus sp.]